jgi:hypothetical protein
LSFRNPLREGYSTAFKGFVAAASLMLLHQNAPALSVNRWVAGSESGPGSQSPNCPSNSRLLKERQHYLMVAPSARSLVRMTIGQDALRIKVSPLGFAAYIPITFVVAVLGSP